MSSYVMHCAYMENMAIITVHSVWNRSDLPI